MTSTDCAAIKGPWPSWVPDEAGASCAATTSGQLTASGKQVSDVVWNFFDTSAKYGPVIAAAIYGNVQVESSFNPIATQVKPTTTDPSTVSSGGWGLFQWTPGNRLATLQTQAGVTGNITDPIVQLNIALYEGQHSAPTGYKNVLGDMQKQWGSSTSVSDVSAATVFWQKNFESGTDSTDRINDATTAFGNRASSSSSGATTTATTLSCSGNTSSIGTGTGKFTTNTSISYPLIAQMLARATAVATMKGSLWNSICVAFGGPNCSDGCDHLAAGVWGESSSGYQSAAAHWAALKNTSHGHPGDRNPPVGASLFYATGHPAGHIATYLGNNMILSNDVEDSKSGVTGGAYIVPATDVETGPWRLTYLGWADPVFQGVDFSK